MNDLWSIMEQPVKTKNKKAIVKPKPKPKTSLMNNILQSLGKKPTIIPPTQIVDITKDVGRGVGGFAASLPQTAGQLIRAYGETKGDVLRSPAEKISRAVVEKFLTKTKTQKQAESRIYKPIAKYGQEMVEANKKRLKESIFTPEKAKYPLAYEVGGALGSLGVSVGLGLATKSSALPAIAFGGIAGGKTYEEAREKKVSPRKAANIASLAGITEAGLEKVGLDVFMKGSTKRLATLAIRMADEGIQEGLQELGSNFWARVGYDKKRALTQNVGKSILIGGLTGGMGDVALSPIQNYIGKKATEAGMTKEEAETIKTKVIEKIKQEAEKAKTIASEGVSGRQRDKTKPTPKLPVTGAGEAVSKFYSNTLQKPNVLPSKVKDIIDESMFTYGILTDEEAITEAKQSIQSKGVAKIMQEIRNKPAFSGGVDTAKAKLITDELTAKGKTSGSYDELIGWLKTIRGKGSTPTAQTLQKFGLFGKETPAGVLRNAEKITEEARTPRQKRTLKQKEREVLDIDKKIIQESIDKTDITPKTKEDLGEPTPEELLAKKITDYVKTGKLKKDDPVKRMVDILFKIAKESPIIKQSKITDPYKVMEFALKNRSEMTDIWSKAKNIVMNEIKGSPEKTALLESYFDKEYKPPFSTADFNKMMEKEVSGFKVNNKVTEKIKTFNLNKIIKEYYNTGLDVKTPIADYFVQKMGLSSEESKYLADYIEKQLHSVIKVKREKALSGIFKVSGEEKSSAIKSVDTLYNLGAFDNTKYLDKLSSKLEPKIYRLLKESNIDFGKLVKKSASEINFTKEKFYQEIKNKTGISRNKDINKIVAKLDEVFSGIVKEKQGSLLRRMLNPALKAPQRLFAERFNELINTGAQNKDLLKSVIAERFNIPQLTNETVDWLVTSADDISKMPIGTRRELYYRNKALDTLMTDFHNKMPKTLSAKAWNNILEAANLPRTLMSSFADLSFGFRQGIFAMPSYRKEFYNSFKKQFGWFGSEVAFEENQIQIFENKWYDFAKEAGLSFTEMDKGRKYKEERYMSSWGEKIPAAGKVVRATERAYTAFANKLRMDVFAHLAEEAEKLGLDPKNNPELIKSTADYVNDITGRGNLHKGIEGAAEVLNAFFFSPKLAMSRLHLISHVFDPRWYLEADPLIRKQYFKDLFRFAGTILTVLGLAKIAGADVGTDPTSSDFMKIKIGKTRIDIMGGFQQYIRMAAQLITGKYTSSVTGKTVTLGEGYRPLNRYEVLLRQIESKEAPVASFVTDLLKQQDYRGRPVNIPEAIRERITPMVLQDIYDITKEDPTLLPLGIFAVFGVGVQTYGNETSTSAQTENDLWSDSEQEGNDLWSIGGAGGI